MPCSCSKKAREVPDWGLMLAEDLGEVGGGMVFPWALRKRGTS